MIDEAKVDVAYAMAKDALDRGETITYREVAEGLDLGHPIPWLSSEFNWILDGVLRRDFDVAANIVTKATGRPADGFYAWCDQQGISYPTRDYPTSRSKQLHQPEPADALPLMLDGRALRLRGGVMAVGGSIRVIQSRVRRVRRATCSTGY